jgi:hypothetical protein
MDKEIGIYEFEWWMIFSGVLIVIMFSITLIIGSLYLLQVINNDWNIFRCFTLMLLGILSFGYSSIYLWTIQSVPKLIIFKQNIINVILPFGQEKVFPYENISRIIIISRLTKRSQVFAKSLFPFRIRMYFLNNKIKVIFNPDRMIDFSAVMEHLKQKGLSSLVEQK